MKQATTLMKGSEITIKCLELLIVFLIKIKIEIQLLNLLDIKLFQLN